MRLPLTGGCQCGAVRYAIDAPPQTLIACHCGECQKQSASAFGMTLKVTRRSLTIAGALNRWDRIAESGNRVSCLFCPTCGSRLIHEPGPDSETVNVKAGSLDDASELEPAGHIWVSRAQPWMRASLHGLVYERAPPDMSALIAAWRDRSES